MLSSEVDAGSGETRLAPSRQAEMFEIGAWRDMLDAMPEDIAEMVGLEIVEIAGAICVAAPGIPSTEFNRCVGLGVDEPATEEQVSAILAHYADRAVANAWVQVMDAARPAGLTGWLEARGLAPAGTGWMMFERGADSSDVAGEPGFAAEIGPDRAEEAAAVFRQGYGLPPFFDRCVAALVGRKGWRTYCAFDDGRIIATAFLFQIGARAQLAGAGTIPENRRRGAQTALMKLRIRDASLAGADVIQSHTWLPGPDAPNPSYANMLRCGFEPVHRRTNYSTGEA